MQDDAAAAGLRLPGPEDDGPGGAAEVTGSADRADASLQRVSFSEAKAHKSKLCHEPPLAGKKNTPRGWLKPVWLTPL